MRRLGVGGTRLDDLQLHHGFSEQSKAEAKVLTRSVFLGGLVAEALSATALDLMKEKQDEAEKQEHFVRWREEKQEQRVLNTCRLWQKK